MKKLSVVVCTLVWIIRGFFQYDMRMCNYHNYYKNNSPKNRYEKVQTTTLGFFIHTYENNTVNKWSVIRPQ
jgi:hypothetical protein